MYKSQQNMQLLVTSVVPISAFLRLQYLFLLRNIN